MEEDNIKMSLKNFECGGVDWIDLSRWRFLRTRQGKLRLLSKRDISGLTASNVFVHFVRTDL